MPRFDFCDGSYQALSPVMDAEECINLVPELIESENGRSAMALVASDGLAAFASLPAGSGQSVPGGFSYNGRTFVVGVVLATQQMHLYEVQGAGAALLDHGAIGAPATSAPAVWAANPNQVVFTVAGTGAIYVFTLATNQITVVNTYADTDAPFAAVTVLYLSGFFVTFLQNSNAIQISNFEDGTTWLSINIANVSEFPDNIVSMKATQVTLWIMGRKQSVPYYNGGGLFPFIAVPQTMVEEGSGTTYAMDKIDNTVVWIGGNDDQGYGIAWRMNGYTPQRISTIAVETAWQSYATIADAISYVYQTRGHKFWHIYFPTANASWRYDIQTQRWHKLGTWNPQTGKFGAHRSQWHTIYQGTHLVGDPFSGNIYSLSVNNLTDNGTPIRRMRRAPYIAGEHEFLFHKSLELLVESGLPSQIAGPSEATQAIYLEDNTGVLWQVQINDAGLLQPTAAQALTSFAPANTAPQTIILADSVNQSTFWQLAITSGGALYGIPVTAGRPDFAILPMATTGPQFYDSGFTINQQGIVAVVQPQTHYREPLFQLRFSDDGGHTWSNWRTAGMGLTGDYRKRVIFRRLGKSRNRVYEVVFSDPVAVRIVDAYINSPDGKPQKRLSTQLSEVA
jgi:hypothetical protein